MAIGGVICDSSFPACSIVLVVIAIAVAIIVGGNENAAASARGSSYLSGCEAVCAGRAIRRALLPVGAPFAIAVATATVPHFAIVTITVAVIASSRVCPLQLMILLTVLTAGHPSIGLR